MELQELYHNKKLVVCILGAVLLSACNDKKAVVSQNDHTIVPRTFLPNTQNGFKMRQDTLWLHNNPYSGFVYELAPNKTDTLFFAGFVNGLLEGELKKWYPNKQLWERRWYRANRKNGLQESYWENGIKRFEFIAKDDAYEGELKEWAQDGLLVHLAHFVNGQEDGTQKSWYSNGKIKSNYFIINGKRYGLLGTKNCKNVSDSIFNLF